jgi:isocitrate dehydrogenase
MWITEDQLNEKIRNAVNIAQLEYKKEMKKMVRQAVVQIFESDTDVEWNEHFTSCEDVQETFQDNIIEKLKKINTDHYYSAADDYVRSEEFIDRIIHRIKSKQLK